MPATSENTNDYILNVYMTKKVPKLSRQTAKYYLETIKHFIQFTNKSLLDINDMDVELYLQWYHAKSGLEYVIRTIGEKSILDRRIYPHLFRKTTATNMVRRGCPRDLVAFYLGHKNGNTKTLNTHYAATDPAQVIQAFRKYGAVA